MAEVGAGDAWRVKLAVPRTEIVEEFVAVTVIDVCVATVHGAAYHMSPYLRISTATADDDLVEGLRRIQTFCEGLH